MKKYYDIAGFVFSVSCDDDKMYAHEGLLEPFKRDECESSYEFLVEWKRALETPRGDIVYKDIEREIYKKDNTVTMYLGTMQNGWENAYAKIERGTEMSRVKIQEKYMNEFSPKRVLRLIGMEHFSLRNHGFILHSSYIVYNGKAILFTAPSGMGKSTQADLWLKYRDAEIVNGDRTIVRVSDDEVLACGLPFSGSSGICKNITVPLGTIVYLGQAPQNKVERLTGIKAFRAIWEGVSVNTWDTNDVSMCTDIVKKVIEEIPVYKFDCLPDESAVIELEQALEEVW